MWADLKRDLRYALRLFGKNPGFTFIAVSTLALGIGVTTAIFSLVDHILLRPLRYPQSDRLVTLVQSYPQLGLDTWRLSPADFALYRDQSTAFQSLAAYWVTGVNLTGVETPERLVASRVTAGFFKVFEINPQLGRTFLSGEDTPGKTNVCVLSYGFWVRHFNRDPGAIGQVMTLNNVGVQVIGVMPQGFEFPGPTTELWIPLELNAQASHPYFLTGVGRLKPNMTQQTAQAETTHEIWAASLQNPHLVGRNQPLPRGADMKTLVVSLKDAIVGKSATALVVLQSAVAFILLIACANIANLLLSRTAVRGREVALRCALGGTPARVIRQLLTESVLLGVLGGIPAVLLAWVIVRALSRMPIASIPRLDEAGIDPMVLLFAFGVSLATGILIGAVPSIQIVRFGLRNALNSAQRGSSARSGGWTKALLVGGQIALCLILLIAAGLVLKSFRQMIAVRPGFEPDKVLTMLLPVTDRRYPSPPQILEFYRDLRGELSTIPGVKNVSFTSNIPFSGEEESDGYIVKGHEPAPGTEPGQAQLQTISQGYFQSMGISVLAGRGFDKTDQPNTPRVAIVDNILADKYWKNGGALGQQIRTTGDDAWMTIVGVVSGVKDQSLAQDMKPHLYLPHSQDPELRMYLVVRTGGDPLAAASAVRSRIKALDPEVPVYAVRPLTGVIGETLNRQKMIDGLLTVFTFLALILAAIGIYGVTSVYVTSRTREFGIRMAVGARNRDVLSSVIKQALLFISSGIAAGLIGAFVLTKFIASLLYNVSQTDPVVFTLLPLFLGLVAVAACYWPAHRAAKTDPVVALRYE